MAIDDLIKEHAEYVKSRTPPTPYTPGMPTDDRGHYYDAKTQQWLPLASGIQDLIDEHKKQYPDVASAAKPPPPWYDQPVDKAGTMPMTDEYGRAIPGSEGMSSASMTPRQLALMASIPAGMVAGPALGALGVGARALPYAAPAINALIGGGTAALAGEGTGGIAASTALGAIPGSGPAMKAIADSNALGKYVLPALTAGAGGGLGYYLEGMPGLASAAVTMSLAHSAFPGLFHALNKLSPYIARGGNALLRAAAPAVDTPAAATVIPAANAVVGTVP